MAFVMGTSVLELSPDSPEPEPSSTSSRISAAPSWLVTKVVASSMAK